MEVLMRKQLSCLRLVLVGGILAAGTGLGQYVETTILVGALPADVLWNPTSSKVYVANGQSHTVTIINGATNQVRAVLEIIV